MHSSPAGGWSLIVITWTQEFQLHIFKAWQGFIIANQLMAHLYLALNHPFVPLQCSFLAGELYRTGSLVGSANVA